MLPRVDGYIVTNYQLTLQLPFTSRHKVNNLEDFNHPKLRAE
jgi:hypothetical protein